MKHNDITNTTADAIKEWDDRGSLGSSSNQYIHDVDIQDTKSPHSTQCDAEVDGTGQ